MPDPASAVRFIQKNIFCSKPKLDWDDFNAIFCKGIFRYVIVKTARQLQAVEATPQGAMGFDHDNASGNAEARPMWQKMNAQKRSKLIEQLVGNKAQSSDQK